MRRFLMGSFLIGPLLMMAGASALAQPNFGLGPIELEDQFPLNLLHLSLVPTSPEVLARGKFKWNSDFLWSNTFATRWSGNYYIDAETRVWRNALKYGLTDDLEIEARLPWIHRGGGDLDHFIDEWHQFFGISRGKRPAFPEDDYFVAGQNSNDTHISLPGTGSELGDLTLAAKYLISPGDESSPAFSIIGELRLPTATSSTYGQDEADLMAGIITSKGWGETFLYAGLSYIYLFDDYKSGIYFADHQLQGFLELEYKLSSELSLLAGLYSQTKTIEKLISFPDYALYGDLGAKYAWSDSTRLHLLIRENIEDADATTDVTFMAGMEYSFAL